MTFEIVVYINHSFLMHHLTSFLGSHHPPLPPDAVEAL